MSAQEQAKENAKLHHFILTYDTELGEWYHNTEEEEEHYPQGTIFNWLSGEWLNGYTGDDHFIEGEEENCKKLAEGLAHMNKDAHGN